MIPRDKIYYFIMWVVILGLIAFGLVLPCSIIDKYNSNLDLKNTDLYNISIVLLILSSYLLLSTCLTKQESKAMKFLRILICSYSIVLPALYIHKCNGNDIPNDTLYGIAISVLVLTFIELIPLYSSKNN